jgi:hypothetical protein
LNSPAAIVAITVFAVTGTALTAQYLLTEGLAMQGTHWIMLLVAIAVGYVAGRMFPQAGQAIGLP